jgi:hypothetical protein
MCFETFRGQFHQQILAAFSLEQIENAFLAHNALRTSTKFGKKCTNLSLKFAVLMLVKLNCKFFVCQPLFDWQKMFGEIDPRGGKSKEGKHLSMQCEKD